jgi:hypothetical protein
MIIPRLTLRRLAGCALLAIATIVGAAWWLTSPGRVTRANYMRLFDRDSLCYPEVVSAFGDPYKAVPGRDPQNGFSMTYFWLTSRSWASISCDDAGRVTAIGFDEHSIREFWRMWWVVNYERQPPF